MNRGLAAAFGAVMVLTAGVDGGPVALALLALALAGVMAGLADRRVVPVPVILSIAALALGDPSPFFAAVSGLAAATYLLTACSERVSTLTVPAVAGMVGFTLVGLAATAIRTDVAWMPLVAPAVMAGVLTVAAMPLLADDRSISAPTDDAAATD